jgi:hypothetical protein
MGCDQLSPNLEVAPVSIRITIEYETIVSWAQRRGAIPSTFRGIERPWPLKFSTGPGDPSLVEIGWDKFFAEFEKADLAFVYRNTGPSGELDDY